MCKMQLTVKTMIIPEIYNYKKNIPMVISQKAWAYLNLFSSVLLPMFARYLQLAILNPILSNNTCFVLTTLKWEL